MADVNFDAVKIVAAQEKDRQFFRNTHHIAYRSVIEPMFGWDEKRQDDFADKDFDERNPHIIEYDDKAVGVIGWQDKCDHLWFGPIFILPEYQNLGIGSFLIKECMRRAENENLALRLQTLKLNEKAKCLYEKLGFKVLIANDVYWQMEYKKTNSIQIIGFS